MNYALQRKCLFFKIVTTPTQPQLNPNVWVDTKMTLEHHPPPPTQTSPPSARVAAMRSLQQQNWKIKLNQNIHETPLQLFFEIFLKHT